MSQIVVPAAARSVITATPKTTFKVGTYTALTDTFTSVLDLNDHVNYWLVSVDMPQPKKVYSRSTTIRAQGERIANWNYQNRHITLTIQLLYEAGTQALLGAVRSLLSAIENPPYRLAFAAPNSTVLTYADVVAVSHTIPYDGKQILAQTLSRIQIDFECAPGFSGDRITLQNLVANPGFEAPSGPGVTVFNDSFANANAYSVQAGSTPLASANVYTIPAGTRVAFGSPEWGAFHQWTIRFQFVGGAVPDFFLHYTDANNYLDCFISSTGISLRHLVAGASHTLASGTFAALTSLNWYWLTITQFPAASGIAPNVQATLYADSAGALGAAITGGAIGPVATFDGVTALSGRPQIAVSGNSLPIGGAFSNVHTLALFGPGGWTFGGTSGTGSASGAWEQNTANTYGAGAVTSYGAARIDAAPAGTLNAYWISFPGGAPAGTTAIPASHGQVFGLAAHVRSSGVGAGCTQSAQVIEWDVNGALLMTTTVAQVTGPQATWVTLSGTYTITSASCAYISVSLLALDSTAGASANGVVWFDNAQCWNETTTGQSVMPYCELRYSHSPAQLMVSGLQGDMPAPATTACGLYVSGSPASTSASFFLGRRYYASTGARLVFPVNTGSMGINGGFASVMGNVLDTSDTNGFNAGPVASGMSVTHGQTLLAQSQLGLYHYFLRGYTANASPSAAVSIYNAAEDFPVSTNLALGTVQGAKLFPCTAAAGWYWIDTGQVSMPVFPTTPQSDPTAIYSVVGTPAFADSGHNNLNIGTGFLLPVDGDVLVAGLYNMLGCSQNWLYVYADAAHSTVNYSLETVPLSNIAAAGGGGNDTTGTDLSIGSTGDTGLRLDPTTTSGYTSGTPTTPVNQFAVLAYDNNTTAFPVAVEFTYAPLYLYPRES